MWSAHLRPYLPYFSSIDFAHHINKLQGAKETAKIILRTDGVPGLYRGFGTVVFGAIPARIVSHLCLAQHH